MYDPLFYMLQSRVHFLDVGDYIAMIIFVLLDSFIRSKRILENAINPVTMGHKNQKIRKWLTELLFEPDFKRL